MIPAAGAQASPAPAAPATLESAFALLARQTDGTVGVAVQRIGGGPVYTLNAGQTFPMASTFKIAVAGAVLARIDRGDFKLDTMVTVDPAVWVQSAGIAEQMKHPGVALSVHNLLELMLTRSDNTATDVMVTQAGGPAAVTAWLRKVGVTSGQRIDADTARLIYRALGITPGPGTFRENIDRAFAADPSKRDMDQKRLPNIPFNNDPRDASTPEAMVQLLAAIQSGKALSASSTKALIEIMERCITGEKRLKGLLPQNTVVAHKTGTLMSIANDVGIVTMPDGSKFAIAVFVKSDTKGVDTQERVIAEIARTAYDHYLLGGQ
ncbi:class A beta-lactamase [Sphingomonas koreensis]|uniref:class A beta-lactamase n=1 Tax=Sphingomonas koreensis TaxID=93064 RepID=UPI0013DFFDCF|nr:class A beta-lactamase [Sphingomonas koreensis]MDC7812312.1 class A beta-lactamase [Sphingomonas koreensis]